MKGVVLGTVPRSSQAQLGFWMLLLWRLCIRDAGPGQELDGGRAPRVWCAGLKLRDGRGRGEPEYKRGWMEWSYGINNSVFPEYHNIFFLSWASRALISSVVFF